MNSHPDAASGRRKSWPPERVEVLKSLWRAGELSAAEIARRLGVTRNAVLGKAHRLGLSGQRPRGRPTLAGGGACAGAGRPGRERTPKPKAARASSSCASARPRQPAELPDGGDPGPGLAPNFERLPPGTCRWPIGDPRSADFSFCGRPAGGRSYCAPHWRRAHAAASPSAKRPRKAV